MCDFATRFADLQLFDAQWQLDDILIAVFSNTYILIYLLKKETLLSVIEVRKDIIFCISASVFLLLITFKFMKEVFDQKVFCNSLGKVQLFI